LNGVYEWDLSIDKRLNYVSGDVLPTVGTILGADGNYTYSLTSTGNSLNLSKGEGEFNINQQLYHVKNRGGLSSPNNFGTSDQSVNSAVGRTATFVNGVITSTFTGNFLLVASANRTVRSFLFKDSSQLTTSTATLWHQFDLEEPIELLNGEGIGVLPGDMETTFTFDEYAPRIFTSETCPIQGIAASGRYQRLIPVFATSDINSEIVAPNSVTTSFILLNDANKMTIPSNYSQTPINSGWGTPITTLPAFTPNGQGGSTLNNFTYMRESWAGTSDAINNVKQIILFSPSSNRAMAVIEFDEAQTIPARHIIYLKNQMQFIQEFAIPSYLNV
jgi:hypothetical protein